MLESWISNGEMLFCLITLTIWCALNTYWTGPLQRTKPCGHCDYPIPKQARFCFMCGTAQQPSNLLR